MSIPQLERDFVRSLISRCSNVFFNRIESATSVGFPDLVMIWSSQSRLAEAKVVHAGDWVYVRNTQMAWCYKALMKGFDCPFLLGMGGQGLGLFRFSNLTGVPGQAIKNTHKRFKTHDIAPVIYGKYGDWERVVISYVFT